MGLKKWNIPQGTSFSSLQTAIFSLETNKFICPGNVIHFFLKHIHTGVASKIIGGG